MNGNQNREHGNLYAAFPDDPSREAFESLLETERFRLERIVSRAQATPPGEWYEQARAEWVILLKGSAALRFEDEVGPRLLRPGDYLLIAPRRRHRVEWTDPDRVTVWLALHYG